MADARENLQERHETESRSVEEMKKKDDEEFIKWQRSFRSNPSSHQSRVSSHRSPILPGKEDCKFYKAGFCPNGTKCRYNHPEELHKSPKTIFKVDGTQSGFWPEKRVGFRNRGQDLGTESVFRREKRDVQKDPQEQRHTNFYERQGKRADKEQNDNWRSTKVQPYRAHDRWGPTRATEIDNWRSTKVQTTPDKVLPRKESIRDKEKNPFQWLYFLSIIVLLYLFYNLFK